MKVRIEVAPDEPMVVVVEIPDDKVTPEMRSKIEAMSEEVPFDTDDLPFGLARQIDWDEVTNIHWCVEEIAIKKPKSGASTG